MLCIAAIYDIEIGRRIVLNDIFCFKLAVFNAVKTDIEIIVFNGCELIVIAVLNERCAVWRDLGLLQLCL